MREFFGGVGDLIRSFAWWRREPGTMALGLIPAAITGVLLAAAVIALGFALPPLVTSLTPFADGWDELWATALRTAIVVAALVGSLFLCSAVFVAVTLTIGDPFYERIWRAVEGSDGGPVPEGEYGFWAGVADSVRLVLRGLGVSIVAGLVGLIPLAGGILGPLVGVLLTGTVLADELTSRAFGHRNISRTERRAITRGYGARLRGFGAATQALTLIPLASIVVIPTAVAGSTILVRRMLGVGITDADVPTGAIPVLGAAHAPGPHIAGGVSGVPAPAQRGTQGTPPGANAH